MACRALGDLYLAIKISLYTGSKITPSKFLGQTEKQPCLRYIIQRVRKSLADVYSYRK